MARLSKRGELSEMHDARARARLLHRIHRLGYQTAEKTLDVGPHRFRFFRIADPDKVLDRVAEEEDRLEKLNGRRTPSDQLHLPYWAELWDSGLAIAGHLLDRA